MTLPQVDCGIVYITAHTFKREMFLERYHMSNKFLTDQCGVDIRTIIVDIFVENRPTGLPTGGYVLYALPVHLYIYI